MIAAFVCAAVALVIAVSPWIWKNLFPRPEIIERMTKADWDDDPHVAQWKAIIKLRLGWLWWITTVPNCRLYFIRKDFGPLDSSPEGIWLKWIENKVPSKELAVRLTAGQNYEAIVVVRDEREGTAYIANEEYIETRGETRRWPLYPGSKYPVDKTGRFTFWLEIRSGPVKWRSRHHYAVYVPPDDSSNEGFIVEPLHEAKAAVSR